MGLTLSMLLLSAQPSLTAYCEKGMRGDPVVRISKSGKYYSIYFMPDQWDDCEKYAAKFQSRELEVICGCKQLIFYGQKDRVRLSCASLYKNKLYGRRVATYFYYPKITLRPYSYCHRLRNKLMLGKRYR